MPLKAQKYVLTMYQKVEMSCLIQVVSVSMGSDRQRKAMIFPTVSYDGYSKSSGAVSVGGWMYRLVIVVILRQRYVFHRMRLVMMFFAILS